MTLAPLLERHRQRAVHGNSNAFRIVRIDQQRGSALVRRAGELSRQYLDGQARPAVVRWVPDMRTQWASCTPQDATIRLAQRLQQVPAWVQDYVLLHELAHLLVPGHWTVQRGHDLAEVVEQRLREVLGDGASVLTHLEPLDDPLSHEDVDLDRRGEHGAATA